MAFSERLRIIFEAVTGKASADTRAFGKDVEDVDRKTDKLEKSHKTRMGGFAKATVAGFGVQQIAAFAGEILNVGVKLEAMAAKARTVFGDQLSRVKSWADENAAAMGLTESAAIGAGAAVADLLKPMGFTAAAATDQTIKLLDLAGALSAWSAGSYDAAQVSEILTKAMLGEREQLKSLGISITEADVSARLLLKGQKDLTGAALAQAKALATQELIFEKSTDAQRAWADGSMDALKAANRSKAGWAEWGEGIKEALLPIPQWAMSADEALRTMAKPGDAAFLEQLIELGRQMQLNGTDATRLATDVLALNEANRDSAVEGYRAAEALKQMGYDADTARVKIELMHGAMKAFRDDLADEKAWLDAQIRLKALAAGFAELGAGSLEAQAAVADMKLTLEAALTNEGVPYRFRTEIVTSIDPNDLDRSIAEGQMYIDAMANHLELNATIFVNEVTGGGHGGSTGNGSAIQDSLNTFERNGGKR